MHSKSLLLAIFLLAGATEATAKSNDGCLQAGRESERLSKVVLDLIKACNQKPNSKIRQELSEQLKSSLAAEKHEVSVCHAGEASKTDRGEAGKIDRGEASKTDSGEASKTDSGEASKIDAGDPSETDGAVDVEKGVRWAQTWIDHLNENSSFCR